MVKKARQPLFVKKTFDPHHFTVYDSSQYLSSFSSCSLKSQQFQFFINLHVNFFQFFCQPAAVSILSEFCWQITNCTWFSSTSETSSYVQYLQFSFPVHNSYQRIKPSVTLRTLYSVEYPALLLERKGVGSLSLLFRSVVPVKL